MFVDPELRIAVIRRVEKFKLILERERQRRRRRRESLVGPTFDKRTVFYEHFRFP